MAQILHEKRLLKQERSSILLKEECQDFNSYDHICMENFNGNMSAWLKVSHFYAVYNGTLFCRINKKPQGEILTVSSVILNWRNLSTVLIGIKNHLLIENRTHSWIIMDVNCWLYWNRHHSCCKSQSRNLNEHKQTNTSKSKVQISGKTPVMVLVMTMTLTMLSKWLQLWMILLKWTYQNGQTHKRCYCHFIWITLSLPILSV